MHDFGNIGQICAYIFSDMKFEARKHFTIAMQSFFCGYSISKSNWYRDSFAKRLFWSEKYSSCFQENFNFLNIFQSKIYKRVLKSHYTLHIKRMSFAIQFFYETFASLAADENVGEFEKVGFNTQNRPPNRTRTKTAKNHLTH